MKKSILKIVSVIMAIGIIASMSCSAFAAITFPYKCETCGYISDDTQDYNEHLEADRHVNAVKSLATTTTATAKEYTCKTCDMVFSSASEYNLHLATHSSNTDATAQLKECPYCGRSYELGTKYNDHLDSHRGTEDSGDQIEYYYDKYVNLSIPDLIDRLISYSRDTGILEYLLDMITRVADYIEARVYSETDVAGAVADLENTLSTLSISDSVREVFGNLIDSLKSKIKSFYAGETAQVEEVTEASASPETGSSIIGIMALASLSIATCAAYVCIHKKDEDKD